MYNQIENIVNLAREAGEAVLEIYNQDVIKTTRKDDDSPLTRADMASHHLIVDGLRQLTPDMPVLSEESKAIPYDERSHWKDYWLIDPLDGTKEFINRRDEFTINIALIHDGSPVMGVVYAPALDITYYAAQGRGAFKQVKDLEPVAIKVSDYRQGSFKMVVSRLHAGEAVEKFLKRLDDDNVDYECLNMGSSLKLCLVAEGAAHLYPRLGPTMEWDTAAAQAVVQFAGGTVTDLQGNVLRYNKPDLLNPSFIVCGAPAYPWQPLCHSRESGNPEGIFR